MANLRYLAKSRFQLACECPAKLYYTGKPNIYPDQKMQDTFLAMLAEGGYQVGELAKRYCPGGTRSSWISSKRAISAQSQMESRA